MTRRKVIVAGVALLAVVGAVFLGVRWKLRADRRAELAARVRLYHQAVLDLTACIADGGHPDLLTSIAFSHAHEAPERLVACEETYDERLATFGDTVRKLGRRAPPFVGAADLIEHDDLPRPELRPPYDREQLDDVCEWLRVARLDLEVLAEATHQTLPLEDGCYLGFPSDRWPPLLDPIGEYLSRWKVEPPLVALRADRPPTLKNVTVFYRSTDPVDDPSFIGYTIDGERSPIVELAADVFLAAPAPNGFVALARPKRPKAPIEVRIHDVASPDAGWKRVGRVPAPDVTHLHAGPTTMTIVSAGVDVLRSRDGGKTFAPPRKLIEPPPAGALEIGVQPDGAVVAIMASATELAITRLDADDDQPREVARLPLAEPQPSLAVCRAGSGFWALAGRRYLVGSADGGATWGESIDLGASTDDLRLYCVGARVIVDRVRDDRHELVACAVGGCDGAIAVVRPEARLLFAREVGADLEVWFDSTASTDSIRRDGAPVWVYRLVGGALTPDRFHFLPSDREDDQRRVLLVNLDDTLGWLDPRSGLGELRWWNGPDLAQAGEVRP